MMLSQLPPVYYHLKVDLVSLQRCQNYQMDDRLISNSAASAGCLGVRA